MRFNFYASQAQPKSVGTSISGQKETVGLDFRLSQYRHDFVSADKGRVIHEIHEVYAPYYNDKPCNGMGQVMCVLNEYVPAEHAREMAKDIQHNPYDQYVGVTHKVGSWPNR